MSTYKSDLHTAPRYLSGVATNTLLMHIYLFGSLVPRPTQFLMLHPKKQESLVCEVMGWRKKAREGPEHLEGH